MPNRPDSPMDKKSQHMEDGQESIPCEECFKQIPRSAAHSTEDKEYIHHFCGKECFDQWQRRAKPG